MILVPLGSAVGDCESAQQRHRTNLRANGRDGTCSLHMSRSSRSAVMGRFPLSSPRGTAIVSKNEDRTSGYTHHDGGTAMTDTLVSSRLRRQAFSDLLPAEHLGVPSVCTTSAAGPPVARWLEDAPSLPRRSRSIGFGKMPLPSPSPYTDGVGSTFGCRSARVDQNSAVNSAIKMRSRATGEVRRRVFRVVDENFDPIAFQSATHSLELIAPIIRGCRRPSKAAR